MCGFVGAYSNQKKIRPKNFHSALKLLKHRGPDASSVWSKDENLFLGHNRLSIIDTSSNSNQPFISKCKNAVIVFNGEIYNYQTLKKQLNSIGFRSGSDTEVILQGYLEQGSGFFSSLRGIYSFAIIDLRNEVELILVRDPGGVKPLYYKEDAGIMFASEIKAIKALSYQNSSFDETSIKQYLNLGFIPEPNTVYKDIHSIRPGYILKFSNNKIVNYKPFFEYRFDKINSYSFEKNIEKTSILLSQSVKRNLTADVDVSVSLSGGIDSSLVYYYANKHNSNILAQTISFDDHPNYDESAISKIYSKNLNGNHKIRSINEDVNLEIINKLFLHFDQPFADSSAIPVYFLNKHASKYGKVIIGGDGGDELFNGYPSQHLLSYFIPLSRFKNLWKILFKCRGIFNENHSRMIFRMYSMIKQNNDPIKMMYHRNSWLPFFSTLDGNVAFNFEDDTSHIDNYKSLFNEEIPLENNYKIIFDYFRKILLSDYLRKTDMMSMLNGVEWRIPFLDEDLTSFAFSIPFSQKSNLKFGKIPLRHLHKKLFPKNTSKLKKQGFSIPLDSYLSEDDKKYIVNEILKKDSIIYHFLNKKYVEELVNEFSFYRKVNQISRASIYQRILMLYVLQLWSTNQ